MGAKTAIVMFADKPPHLFLRGGLKSDESAAKTLAAKAFPAATLTPVGELNLAENARPASGLVCAARFPGVDVLACDRFMLNRPSALPDNLLALADGRALYVHFRQSVSDWLAFGEYRDGAWIRSLSLAPDHGVMEDLGTRLACEAPYWDGHYPMSDYPLPFHPLELAEDVMAETFGFTLEGRPTALDPFDILFHGFRID